MAVIAKDVVTRANPLQTAIAGVAALKIDLVYLCQEGTREQVILGRLRLAYSSYSRNPKVVSGLRCARSTTRVIQRNSYDRDHGDKPLMYIN